MKIIISVYSGVVKCEDCPDNVILELHDYDIQEIEENNSDRKYGHDETGDYEIIII
jgi:hypothetical protein